MVRQRETSLSKGVRLGAGIAVGIIVIIILFFVFFQPRVELQLDGTIQPSLNINPSANGQSDRFCPKIEDLSFRKSGIDNVTGWFVVSLNEYKRGEYSFGGNNSLSMCGKGSLQGQNINYFYCPVLYAQIDDQGNIVSQNMFSIEINPKTNQILSINC